MNAAPTPPAVEVGNCRNGTLHLSSKHASADPWLEFLCSKASAPFPGDSEVWAQYTKVYRQLSSFRYGGDIQTGVSSKIYANGTVSSNRYHVIIERANLKSQAKFEEGLALIRNVAEEMDAPSNLVIEW